MKIGGSTAWRSITQPISDQSLSDALVGLPAPARDIHRASEYVLHPPGTALGLLGVLLEGPSPRGETVIYRHFEEATDAG